MFEWYASIKHAMLSHMWWQWRWEPLGSCGSSLSCCLWLMSEKRRAATLWYMGYGLSVETLIHTALLYCSVTLIQLNFCSLRTESKYFARRGCAGLQKQILEYPFFFFFSATSQCDCQLMHYLNGPQWHITAFTHSETNRNSFSEPFTLLLCRIISSKMSVGLLILF